MHCVSMCFFLRPQINLSLNLGQAVSTLESECCCCCALDTLPKLGICACWSTPEFSGMDEFSVSFKLLKTLQQLVQDLLYQYASVCLDSAHSRRELGLLLLAGNKGLPSHQGVERALDTAQY